MRNINIFASKLGTQPINIDNPPDNFDIYLKINESKYTKYEENFLTSVDKNESNIEILTRSIFHYWEFNFFFWNDMDVTKFYRILIC